MVTEQPSTPEYVSLSQLLSDVKGAVSKAFPRPQWVLVEITGINLSKEGHRYISIVEAQSTVDSKHKPKTTANIWSYKAHLVKKFQDATGIELSAGISVVLLVTPTFHEAYGFNLTVTDIDASYTIGQQKLKKKENIKKLTDENLIDRNRNLPTPTDFFNVLVVAPNAAAGLGDFTSESDKLEKHNICHFEFAYSQFQGREAPQLIWQALKAALDKWNSTNSTPLDAIVIIRGGGSVNDLAYLDNYYLARYLCLLDIPVFTGIGHERDQSLLDIVAHTSFSTPSKVIGHITNSILHRTREAKVNFSSIQNSAQRIMDKNKQLSLGLFVQVGNTAQSRVADYKLDISGNYASIKEEAIRTVRKAEKSVEQQYQLMKTKSQPIVSKKAYEAHTLLLQIQDAARKEPQRVLDSIQAMYEKVNDKSSACISSAKEKSLNLHKQITTQASNKVLRAKGDLEAQRKQSVLRFEYLIGNAQNQTQTALDNLLKGAQFQISNAKTQTDGMIREILGQGPEKTLKRGFTITSNTSTGQTITQSSQVTPHLPITIQFSDGTIEAISKDKI